MISCITENFHGWNFCGKQASKHKSCQCHTQRTLSGCTNSMWLDRGRQWALRTSWLSSWNSLKIMQHWRVVELLESTWISHLLRRRGCAHCLHPVKCLCMRISYELNFHESNCEKCKNYTLCGSLQSNEVYSVAEFPQYLASSMH